MKTILVCVNSKYVHKNLGVWCLYAHLEKCGHSAAVLEYTVNEPYGNIVKGILDQSPDIVCFSAYIWNIGHVEAAARAVKAYDKDITVILGGPEVIDAENEPDAYGYADFIVVGEGEEPLATLLDGLKSGQKPQRIQRAARPYDIAAAPTPYTGSFFDSFAGGGKEIPSRILYYESSRGCPFSCAYCLSGCDNTVRTKPLSVVEEEISVLVSRGAKIIKFVDRTFNADKKRALEILRLISRYTSCRFHFEVGADLFDDKTIEYVSTLSPGLVQFEAGIQSVNPDVLQAVCRRSDIDKALRNIERLVKAGNCHIHADLIAGLPGETPESTAEGFDRVILTRPHVLQLGFLKYLKGSGLRRAGGIFSPLPPYEVLRTDALSHKEISLLKDIENALDGYYNSGLFRHTFDALFADGSIAPFSVFLSFSDYLKDKPALLSMPNRYRHLLGWIAGLPDKAHLLDCLRRDMLLHSRELYYDEYFDTSRDREHERDYLAANPDAKNMLRAEFFRSSGLSVLVRYDKKDPVTGEFLSVTRTAL